MGKIQQLALPGFELTTTGLTAAKSLTRVQWQEAGQLLGGIERRLMWFVGDWLNAGQSSGYVERGKHEEACERFGIAYKTAANAASACKALESSRRREHLSFEHHKEIANRDDADELLDWCEENDASVKELREEKKRRAKDRGPGSPSLPTGKYDLILADPPWQYDFAETNNRKIENHYPTMELDELQELKLPASDNCLLLLWATAPKLMEAYEVINAWEFDYKTQAIWDKEVIGMGYWFRGQHELLLVATRGDVSPPEQDSRVSSVFQERRGKHSAKPDCVYDWIDAAFPDSTKCEMFARSHREGWSSWGNEV